jgi:PAS domain S-box-containing protein
MPTHPEKVEPADKLSENNPITNLLGNNNLEFESLLNFMPDIVYMIDGDGNILFINDEVEKYGLKAESLKGINIFDIIHPEDAEKSSCIVKERRSSKERSKSVVIRFRKDINESIPFEIKANELSSVSFFKLNAKGIYENGIPSAGNFIGTIGIARDITEKVKAENILAESETKFRTIAENSPDVIIRFDRELRHLYANPVIETSTGIKAVNFIGKTHRELNFPTELCEYWESKIENVFKTGKAHSERYEYTGINGRNVFDWKLIPELITDGVPKTVLSISRDITDLIEIQEKNKLIIEELSEAARDVRTLSGLLPICSYCKKIRNDKGYWEQIENYIRSRSDIEFSHGICPDCMDKYYKKYLNK